MKYEVYIARDENRDVVYIGEGKKGRHLHVNSGISNVYELNERHFQGERFDIELIPVESKEDCVNLERDLIKEMKPIYNSNTSPRFHVRKNFGRVRNDVEGKMWAFFTFVIDNCDKELVWSSLKHNKRIPYDKKYVSSIMGNFVFPAGGKAQKHTSLAFLLFERIIRTPDNTLEVKIRDCFTDRSVMQDVATEGKHCKNENLIQDMRDKPFECRIRTGASFTYTL